MNLDCRLKRAANYILHVAKLCNGRCVWFITRADCPAQRSSFTEGLMIVCESLSTIDRRRICLDDHYWLTDMRPTRADLPISPRFLTKIDGNWCKSKWSEYFGRVEAFVVQTRGNNFYVHLKLKTCVENMSFYIYNAIKLKALKL